MNFSLLKTKKFGVNVNSFALIENVKVIGTISFSIYKGNCFVEALTIDENIKIMDMEVY